LTLEKKKLNDVSETTLLNPGLDCVTLILLCRIMKQTDRGGME